MNDFAAGVDLSVEALVGQVADEFTERLNCGEQPAVEEYAQRYPQIADLLRQALPALLAMAPMASDAALSDQSTDPQELTGCLGDFRIVREIGRGGMGIVYEAEQISLGRRVALKVLPFAAALDPKHLQRFKKEAQAAAQLHHTNIVPVFGVGCERGVHYYAMQYIEGQTVAAVIAELRQQAGLDLGDPGHSLSEAASNLVSGRLAPVNRATSDDPLCVPCGAQTHRPAPTGQTIARADFSTEGSIKSTTYFRTVAGLGLQAAEALEHAHELGVVHRDIKPANLLVDVRGNLWITDFGLAHLQSNPGLTLSGDLMGTLRYMSPEQAMAKRALIDQRTDVYSLGVTLYELLTLEPAFGGSDREELLRQIAFEEPRPPRRLNKPIPAELETIVLKAMEKNPTDRYATAQDVADDVRRFLEDKPIQAKRPTLRERVRKWTRRHKTLMWSLLVAVLVVLVAVAIVLTWALIHINAARNAESLARRDAEEKTHATAEAKEEEERSFKLAFEAVDRYFTQVSESPELEDRGLDRLRQDLLQSAKEFYTKFIKERGGEPKLKSELARAYFRLALITNTIGSEVEAITLFEQTQALFDELTRARPAVTNYQLNLALCKTKLGQLYAGTGKPDKAAVVYRESVAIYEKLVREDAGLQGKPPELARCQDSMGFLYRVTGQPEKAVEAYRSALKEYEKLAGENPKVRDYRAIQGRIHHNLGLVYRSVHKEDLAENAYLMALAIQKELVREYPESTGYLQDLSTTHYNLGNVYRDTKRPVQVAAAFQAAIDLQHKLVLVHPAVALYGQQLARSLGSLGVFYCDTNQFGLAEAQYRKALPIQEKLARDHPSVLDYAVDLAVTYAHLGDLLFDSVQTEAKLEWYGKSINTLEGVLKQDKRHGKGRHFLDRGYITRARVLAHVERHAEAVIDYDRAIALTAEGDQDAYRLARVLSIVRVGDHVRATREAEELVVRAADAGDVQYDLACVYSLSSWVAHEDESLPEAERDKLADDYAAFAIRLLTKLDDAGYFKDPQNIEQLKNDEDFDPLRAQKEFKKLLDRLQENQALWTPSDSPAGLVR
jgi:serine/threonine protein kinase/tetratricopeptide (TPR) repeat protein